MNATMGLSQRADALEAKMAQELDYIVVKSRLHALADADMSPPPNARALMKGDPSPPGAALLSRRLGRLRVSAGLRLAVRRGLPSRSLRRRGLQADAEPQVVHVGPPDHPARYLLVRSQPACRARRVHRHHRPQ